MSEEAPSNAPNFQATSCNWEGSLHASIKFKMMIDLRVCMDIKDSRDGEHKAGEVCKRWRS